MGTTATSVHAARNQVIDDLQLGGIGGGGSDFRSNYVRVRVLERLDTDLHAIEPRNATDLDHRSNDRLVARGHIAADAENQCADSGRSKK